jgi:transcriptional regulator with XRE-family HTH domain
MTDPDLSQSIRAKKLGALLRDARLYSKKSVEECAAALNISPESFKGYEVGEQSPSLPELEILAYYLKVPIDHFWGHDTLAGSSRAEKTFDLPLLLTLRKKVLGAQIRHKRTVNGLDLEDLEERTGISVDEIRSYELGERLMPLPVLEVLAGALNCSVKDFQDQHSPVGSWINRERALEGLMEMPPDLQAFISRPVNRPYIELAQRLSEMPVEKLRTVAEGLLEITL